MSKKPASPAGEARSLSALLPNPLNPRTPKADDPKTVELADSIRAQGILQPLLITPHGLIVAGHRRYVAAKLAGLKEVPVLVRALTEAEQLGAILSENLQREDLNPLEAAKGCAALRQRNLTIEQISKATGLGKGTVSKYLQVLELPLALQKAVAEFDLFLAAVPEILKLPTTALRLEIGGRAADEHWLISEIEKAVTVALGPRAKQAPPRAGVGGQLDARRQTGTVAQKKAKLLDQLCEVATTLRHSPEFVTDDAVNDWLLAIGKLVSDARRKVA